MSLGHPIGLEITLRGVGLGGGIGQGLSRIRTLAIAKRIPSRTSKADILEAVFPQGLQLLGLVGGKRLGCKGLLGAISLSHRHSGSALLPEEGRNSDVRSLGRDVKEGRKTASALGYGSP